jgi:hypothetical protein
LHSAYATQVIARTGCISDGYVLFRVILAVIIVVILLIFAAPVTHMILGT